jgi:glycyl-tRNA synthetase alpha subunit
MIPGASTRARLVISAPAGAPVTVTADGDKPAAVRSSHRHLFDETYKFGEELLKGGLILPALEHCLKCSHLFNLLDSSGSVGVTERMAYILRVRQLALAICKEYVGQLDAAGAGSREPGAHHG